MSSWTKAKPQRFWAWQASAFAVCILVTPAGHAREVDRTVSHEAPSFDVASSRLAVGRDGRVYLASEHYVLGTALNGADQRGADVAKAVTEVAVNAGGVVATSNALFFHSVNLLDGELKKIGTVPDFLGNDDVSWNSPTDVEAAPSGDFYAIDPNRSRIVRVASPGRVTNAYPVDALGVRFTRFSPQLRVWEAGRRFYVTTPPSGDVRSLSFDGKELGKSIPHAMGWSSGGWHGGFDVDDAGRLFVLADNEDVVRVYDHDGQETGRVHLQMGPRVGSISDLRLAGREFVVKRRTADELFEVYDGSGAFVRAVPADLERVRVTMPDGPWTSGSSVQIHVTLETSRHVAPPRWKAWLRPLGIPKFIELPWQDSSLSVPGGLGGAYQLRISPDVRGGKDEYTVDVAVEIRAPGAIGSISIQTPLNRFDYGRGEAIPIDVGVRVRNQDQVPGTVRLRLVDGDHTIAATDVVTRRGAPSRIDLPSQLTRALLPGHYVVTADAPGLTVASQEIALGPGIERPPVFSVVQYGDYQSGLPGGDVFDVPENVADHLSRSRKLGLNMFVDRLSTDSQGGEARLLEQTLTAGDLVGVASDDPAAIPAAKASIEGAVRRSIAGYGALGIEERAILLDNDAGLPLGSGYDHRSPAQLSEAIARVTTSLSAYPSFRGWSWAANWWNGQFGVDATRDPSERAAYAAALKLAETSGAWSPILEAVNDRVVRQRVDAETQFSTVLRAISKGKVSAMTGPYRALGVLPPVTFRNADEVDLHFQSEQIQPPLVTAHNVDFYKRPGKRAWGHPELWNDDGTGGMILPTVLQMAMRGADGVGWSGPIMNGGTYGGTGAADPRSSGPGVLSVVRSLGKLLGDYGPWLTNLRAEDPLAIVVSSRMMRIDLFGGFGGHYFARLYEAYGSCLYAHRPASFVFAEDVTSETLKSYRAVLVVGQRVELEPVLAEALGSARRSGTTVYFDGTSNPALLREFSALDVSFDRIDHDPSVWQDDSAYLRIPGYFREHAEQLKRAFGSSVPPVVNVDDPDVMATVRSSGAGKFLWLIDNASPVADPGLAWRTSLIMSQRLPQVVTATLNSPAGAIYDVFGLRREASERSVDADLRALPARLYAILPHPIETLELKGYSHATAGCPLHWSLQIKGPDGRAIPASLPIRVELVDASGRVLRSEALSTNSEGDAADDWIAPSNAPGTALRLRAVELVSGKTASLPVSVPAAPTQDLGGGLHPGLNCAAGPVERSVGRDAGETVSTATERLFGPHLKALAVSAKGKLAVINAMNWDENLFGLDLDSGGVRWRQRIGDHFAYGPEATATGFAVQGFDRSSPEGYYLHLLDPNGISQRRFALYGLPERATTWSSGAHLADRIDQFAVSPDGDWVASAGNLGLVVWDAKGRSLWSDDWWKTDRRRAPLLVVLDAETIVTLDAFTVTAYAARNGTVRWRLKLDGLGNIQGAAVASGNGTLAVRTDCRGGRVFVIRGGRLLDTIATAADDVALSADGRSLVVTEGRELRWYVEGALAWTLHGDDVLGVPVMSADGQRLAIGSELGTLYVTSADGRLLLERDCGALPVGAWLDGGDLLLATWMGDVTRLDGSFHEKWSVHLVSQTRSIKDQPSLVGRIPTTRVDTWDHAVTGTASVVPNLLAQTNALITADFDGRRQEWQNPIAGLTDGSSSPPPRPWLTWTAIDHIESGWFGPLNIEVDAFHSQLRVDGVTFVEDSAHPESWLRDTRIQYWDSLNGVWRDGPRLLSNAAIHEHRFETPIEAARFRFVSSGGSGWPVGNVRLGELVFHGRVLGGSHPDVEAKRPVAVLFDERDDDVGSLVHGPHLPFTVAYGDAYSGGKALALTTEGTTEPRLEAPFGHTLPDWDFEIVEHPQPGQYRWLQFAWKATSPQTTGLSLLLGRPGPEGGYSFAAGTHQWREAATFTKRIAETVPSEWTIVRVDLWNLARRPMRIQALSLAATGGGAAFDRILLARSEEDLIRTPPAPRSNGGGSSGP